MIAKIDVRKRLAIYEQKIREEKKAIETELEEMRKACTTNEINVIWHQSKEYAKLIAKWEILSEVLTDIIDIRCEKIFED